MVTMLSRSGYRCLPLLVLLLGACSARPVLHEFPPMLTLEARPPAVVNYTLEIQPETEQWELLGGQGASIGTFKWERAFRETQGNAGAIDRSEDLVREDRIHDGINAKSYLLRVSATSARLRDSLRSGTAPPRATIVDASGDRIGDLELRTGFDHRIEGQWRGRSILWRIEFVQGGVVERDTDAGAVEDTYPTAQFMQWVGGLDAGLKIYMGREVEQGNPPEFGAPFFDVAADRPLSRAELGDTVVLLMAVRALQEFAGLTNM